MASYLKPSIFSTPSIPSLASFARSQSSGDFSDRASHSVIRTSQPAFASRSPGLGRGATIKCSDCGREIEIEELGEHVCGASGGVGGGVGEKRKVDMRIDVQRTRGFDDQVAVGSPPPLPRIPNFTASPTSLSPTGYFSTTSASTSDPLSRSASASSATSMESATSTASATKLPFFERYNKLVVGGPSGSSSSNASLNSPKSDPESPRWGGGSSPSLLLDRFGPRAGTGPRENVSQEVATPELTLEGFATSKLALRPVRAPTYQSSSPPHKASGMVVSRSGTSGLDRFSLSLKRGVERRAGRASVSSSLSSRYKGVGLEGLMGDLMAEMGEPKAGGKSRVRDVAEVEDAEEDENATFFGAYAGEAKGDDDGEDNATTPRPEDKTIMPSTRDTYLPASLPEVRPSDSISQLDPLRSPLPQSPLESPSSSSIAAAKDRQPPSPQVGTSSWSGESAIPTKCQHCRRKFDTDRKMSRRISGIVNFCVPCYAQLYLPKCRRCNKPIEKGAVADRVGKVLGKYHSECFNCYRCQEKFPNGEFYVWERKPVCYRHYHELAGTMCANETCIQGIEGPCIVLSLSDHPYDPSSEDDAPLSNTEYRRLYHPEHFTCSRLRCGVSLHEYHFVVAGKPWCERHAAEDERWTTADADPPRTTAGKAATSSGADRARRAEKRRTVVKNVGGR